MTQPSWKLCRAIAEYLVILTILVVSTLAPGCDHGAARHSGHSHTEATVTKDQP